MVPASIHNASVCRINIKHERQAGNVAFMKWKYNSWQSNVTRQRATISLGLFSSYCAISHFRARIRVNRCHVASDRQSDKSSYELDIPAADGEFCMPGEVSVDNSSHDDYTVLQVEVLGYPGLFRVIAWVLNGLDCVVEHAEAKTTDDGICINTFWLTNLAGVKLTKGRADLLAERVGDFVTYCSPDRQQLEATHFSSKSIEVDNGEDATCTVVSIKNRRSLPNALLNVASVITGVGLTIRQALVQPCSDPACSGKIVKVQLDPNTERLFKFWVVDRSGNKLNYDRISALMYTLGLVLDQNQAPTTPPLAGK